MNVVAWEEKLAQDYFYGLLMGYTALFVRSMSPLWTQLICEEYYQNEINQETILGLHIFC